MTPPSRPAPRPVRDSDESPAGAPGEKPSREEAETAIRTLLRWAGDDPAREGLLDTPARVARAFMAFIIRFGSAPLTTTWRWFAVAVKSWNESSTAPPQISVHRTLTDALSAQDQQFAEAFQTVRKWIGQKAFPGAVLAAGQHGRLLVLKSFGRMTRLPCT